MRIYSFTISSIKTACIKKYLGHINIEYDHNKTVTNSNLNLLSYLENNEINSLSIFCVFMRNKIN